MEDSKIVYLCIECNKPIVKDLKSKRLKSTRFHDGCRIKYEQKNEFNKCECGCGNLIPRMNKNGAFSKFKHGHNMKGEHNRGSNCHQWKGDEVQYQALHAWVRTHLPKPDSCDFCHKDKKLDLANYTGVYQRDDKNWKYLCRSCHLIFDRRVTKK